MTFGESEPNPTSDHLLDWLGDSVSFLPSSFLDDPYSGEINGCDWWDQVTAQDDCPIEACPIPTFSSVSDSQLSDSSRKRKNVDEEISEGRRKDSRPIEDNEELAAPAPTRRAVKKSRAKGVGNNGNNGKEGRWAEQLLLPCAAAAAAGNPSRVQHLLYVVNELASASGDANHRLAHYGLIALKHHLSGAGAGAAGQGFEAAEARFFQKTVLKFNELSPWFAFPNTVATASILQVLAEDPLAAGRGLHVLEIGVSHGVQFPILLEALSRASGGPPPLVRITVVSGGTGEASFARAPSGGDFTSKLLGFAQTLDPRINLEVNLVEGQQLQTLNPQIIRAKSSPSETLIVSTQFRLHRLNHHSSPDEKSDFLKSIASLSPQAVILTENDSDCSCNACGDFSVGFTRRVESLWRFLDSTSSAFKGRESDERRLMEGEAAKGLTDRAEMNEGKEKWVERMGSVGFVGARFGEDAIDGARALLRKYDGNWDMKVEEKDGSVIAFSWKNQPVSFSSLWKLSEVKTDR